MLTILNSKRVSFSHHLPFSQAVAPKQESVSIGTQTDVVDFEHAPLTKKKPQTPAELEQALALEQSRVAALKEELAAVCIFTLSIFLS